MQVNTTSRYTIAQSERFLLDFISQVLDPATGSVQPDADLGPIWINTDALKVEQDPNNPGSTKRKFVLKGEEGTSANGPRTLVEYWQENVRKFAKHPNKEIQGRCAGYRKLIKPVLKKWA